MMAYCGQIRLTWPFLAALPAAGKAPRAYDAGGQAPFYLVALSKARPKPSSGTSMLIVRLLVSWSVILSVVPLRNDARNGSFKGMETTQPALVQVCTGRRSAAPLSTLSWTGSV